MTTSPASTGSFDSAKVIATIELLNKRIEERFPNAKLLNTSCELLRVSRQAQSREKWIQKPMLKLRYFMGATVLFLLTALVVSLAPLDFSTRSLDFVLLINLIEGGINTLVLLSAAVFFLFTFEGRVKRRRALNALHELRSIAHLVDLHQLTKDPDRVVFSAARTKSSPNIDMNLVEMSRYLDYCCEMFSLIGKVAFMYGIHWHDDVALQAANDVERLTTGLSQKVFQKMMLLHGILDRESGTKRGQPSHFPARLCPPGV